MKRRLFILALLPSFAFAQSAKPIVTLSDTTVIGNSARPGLNLGQPSGNYPFFKNYLAFANPGFEPILMQQIYQFQKTQDVSSRTSFRWNINNSMYEGYDPNQWAGATFNVIQGSYALGAADPALGCTGTLASSTNEPGAGPIFVINAKTNQGSSGCAGDIGAVGQVITIQTNNKMRNVYPTPASVWAMGSNGLVAPPKLIGGATIASETTDLCESCGSQSLLITVAPGGTAVLETPGILSTGSGKTVVLNGTYTISFWAKSNASIPPQLVINTLPRSGPGCSRTYSGNSSPAITATWTQYSFSCTFAETPANGGPDGFQITFAVSAPGGAASSLEFDNWSFTNNADTNPTVYADAFVNALKSFCQTAVNTTGPACTLRYGPAPDSEIMSNWVKPSFEHQPSIETIAAISTAYGTNKTSIYDFLQLCAYIGATPVVIFPITMSTSDAANLVDFLEGPATTMYGRIRSRLGQATPWAGAPASPFRVIYLEFGNENWNGVFVGHSLGFNNAAPSEYMDYVHRSKTVFAAARARQAAQGYSQSATRWAMGFRTGSPEAGALGSALGDVAAWNGYTASSMGDLSTNGCLSPGSTNASCPLYGPTLTEPYANTHAANSKSGFYQSVLSGTNKEHNCGPSGTAQCESMVYEENTSPQAGAGSSSPFNQAVADSFVQAGVQGVISGDQFGENDRAGVILQNLYQAEQYSYGQSGMELHMWGVMIDIAGDCSLYNAAIFGGNYCPRPQMLAAQVYNWCKIGPMVQTSWTSSPTYDLPANNNNVNEIKDVPVLRSYAFAEGAQRCMVIVNADVYSSYPVTFAGRSAPSTNVTTYQFAPPALASTNEAAARNLTSTVTATMHNTTSTGVNVTSGYTVPAHSVTAFKWTVEGSRQAPDEGGSKRKIGSTRRGVPAP